MHEPTFNQPRRLTFYNSVVSVYRTCEESSRPDDRGNPRARAPVRPTRSDVTTATSECVKFPFSRQPETPPRRQVGTFRMQIPWMYSHENSHATFIQYSRTAFVLSSMPILRRFSGVPVERATPDLPSFYKVKYFRNFCKLRKCGIALS